MVLKWYYFLFPKLFSHSVMSDFLRPHGQQHTRLPCSSLSPRICSNSCPLSRWCHPTISSSVAPFSSCLLSFPASGSFPESVLHIRWSKYWSFSISPFDELQQNLWISFSWASLNQSLLLDPWLCPGWQNTLTGTAGVTHSLTSGARGRKSAGLGGRSFPKVGMLWP